VNHLAVAIEQDFDIIDKSCRVIRSESTFQGYHIPSPDPQTIESDPNKGHSFTNPDAAKGGMDALEYNAEADQKSWAAMLELLKEVFR